MISLRICAVVALFAVALSLITMGTAGILLAEPSNCHGHFGLQYDEEGEPIDYWMMNCVGECLDPAKPICRGHLTGIQGSDIVRVHCACCDGATPAGEPDDCHMYDYRQLYHGDQLSLGMPQCTGDCPVQKPICDTKTDEPNEDGWVRVWCECRQ